MSFIKRVYCRFEKNLCSLNLYKFHGSNLSLVSQFESNQSASHECTFLFLFTGIYKIGISFKEFCHQSVPVSATSHSTGTMDREERIWKYRPPVEVHVQWVQMQTAVVQLCQTLDILLLFMLYNSWLPNFHEYITDFLNTSLTMEIKMSKYTRNHMKR